MDTTELPTSYTVEDENLPLVSYTLKGYRFRCWEKDGLVMNYIPTGSTGDLVLQGKFDDTFTVTYVDSKFGRKNESNPEIFSVTMDPIELLPLEDTTDYHFAGLEDELGRKVTEIDTSCGGDITLYATWEKKFEFENFDYIVDEESGRNILLGVKDKTLTVINKSKYKEWVVSGRVDATFMDALMASDNAPEKIYYGYRSFEKHYSFFVNNTLTLSTTYQYFLSDVDGALWEQYGTAEQIERWKLAFYSPTDPYAEGGATSIDNADIEYWYHDDGAEWYKSQCFVTPKTWKKTKS